MLVLESFMLANLLMLRLIIYFNVNVHSLGLKPLGGLSDDDDKLSIAYVNRAVTKLLQESRVTPKHFSQSCKCHREREYSLQKYYLS